MKWIQVIEIMIFTQMIFKVSLKINNSIEYIEKNKDKKIKINFLCLNKFNDEYTFKESTMREQHKIIEHNSKRMPIRNTPIHHNADTTV